MNLFTYAAKKGALLNAARDVSRTTGKSVPAQLREIVRLRFGEGKLKPSEYYAYEVFDDRRYTPAAKREWVSWERRKLGNLLNDPEWKGICRDKVLFYGLLKGLGLPFPEVYALYDRRKRNFGSVPTFSSPEGIADFLRDGMRYPFFAKTVHGIFGEGASGVQSYQAETDRLVLHGGKEIGVKEYVARFVSSQPSGYLFQERVTPSPFIQKTCGDRVSTLRMVVLNGDDGPRLFRVVWRVPVSENITDNYIGGESGNLKGWIDPETGIVEHMVQGLGSARARAYGRGTLGTEVHHHPDSGERVSGIHLPDWDQAVSVCLRAASVFPKLRYQAWDIALSDRGPMILELNFQGNVPQVPGCRGAYDDELRAFIGKYARSGKKSIHRSKSKKLNESSQFPH